MILLCQVLAAGSALASNSINALPADGFDFPVGKPDGEGFYKARGFKPYGHLGEDWNGRGGGNSDLGAPVYASGHGVVVFSEDYKLGWGNVIIVRHAYRGSNGRINYVDSLYGHLDERYVELHETVQRGQKIGTIGNNRGMYWAHLHFEMRKNLEIGMDRSAFAQGSSNYHDPTAFIRENRTLRREYRTCSIPVNSFDASYRPADARPDPDAEIPRHTATAAAGSSSAVEREIDRFLDSHRIMKPPAGYDSSQDQAQLHTPYDSGTSNRDTDRDQSERDKIRTFWQKARPRAGDA